MFPPPDDQRDEWGQLLLGQSRRPAQRPLGQHPAGGQFHDGGVAVAAGPGAGVGAALGAVPPMSLPMGLREVFRPVFRESFRVGQEVEGGGAGEDVDPAAQICPQHGERRLRLGPVAQGSAATVRRSGPPGAQHGRQPGPLGGRPGSVETVRPRRTRRGTGGRAGRPGLGDGPLGRVERLELGHPVDERPPHAGGGSGVRLDERGEQFPGPGPGGGAAGPVRVTGLLPAESPFRTGEAPAPGGTVPPELRQRLGRSDRFGQLRLPGGRFTGGPPLPRYAERLTEHGGRGSPRVGAEVGGGQGPVEIGTDQHRAQPPEQGEDGDGRHGPGPAARGGGRQGAESLGDGEALGGGQARRDGVQDVDQLLRRAGRAAPAPGGVERGGVERGGQCGGVPGENRRLVVRLRRPGFSGRRVSSGPRPAR
ncbi:hypothetical protein [Streptomyces sp. NPDC091649]|uniref:hypothetical protein n=1 Tax=Streptomyces sp. NPDC091649 TaxID=3366004 RepID=UPI0038253392